MVPCFDFRAYLSTMLVEEIGNGRLCLREWGTGDGIQVEGERWRTRGRSMMHLLVEVEWGK
jgi:hypothetical protein